MARPISVSSNLLLGGCARQHPDRCGRRAGSVAQMRARAADIEPQGAVFRAAVARFMTLTTYVNESLNRVVTC